MDTAVVGEFFCVAGVNVSRKEEACAGFLRSNRDEKNPARTSAIQKTNKINMNEIAEFVQFICWNRWLLLLERYGYFYAAAAGSRCTSAESVIADKSTV